MKAKEIYQLFVKLGIDNDPRGRAVVEKKLARAKERYEKLSKDEKAEFDTETLTNPYCDTRFLVGDENKVVDKVIAGIDMEVGEVLLADRLNEKGEGIDLVIAHHPEGRAFADLDKVMHIQSDVLATYGVPINVAEGVLQGRISEISRAVAPANHQRPVDAARLLGLDMMCAHTVADNMVHSFVEKYLAKKDLETVGDVIDALKEIPEYAKAVKLGAGPRIFIGNPEGRCGKVAVTEMTGGTEGSKEIYEKMAQAGIGTIIGMHMSEEHKKEAEKYHLNVVIAGHMASDSVGMNLLLDEIEKKGVKVISASGLIRVKRFK
jgi:putative NIF3 family GTP cyclohydrolase 1 type 2